MKPYALIGIWTLILLIAGIHPKGFSFQNCIDWDTKNGGLLFTKYSAAETAVENTQLADSFEVRLEIGLLKQAEPEFSVILNVRGDSDNDQLILAQWNNSLILLNGNDFDYSREKPRLEIQVPDISSVESLLIRGGINQTALLSVSGIGPTVEQTLQRIVWPKSKDNVTLILGNSWSRKFPWVGSIKSFQLNAVDSEEYSNYLYFPLDEGHGNHAVDEMSGMKLKFGNIESYSPFEILGTEFDYPNVEDLLVDAFLNVSGFVILGYLLTQFWGGKGYKVLLVFLIGIVLSLIFESFQAVIPTRTSSIWDLLMNTAGTCLGSSV